VSHENVNFTITKMLRLSTSLLLFTTSGRGIHRVSHCDIVSQYRNRCDTRWRN